MTVYLFSSQLGRLFTVEGHCYLLEKADSYSTLEEDGKTVFVMVDKQCSWNILNVAFLALSFHSILCMQHHLINSAKKGGGW